MLTRLRLCGYLRSRRDDAATQRLPEATERVGAKLTSSLRSL